MTAPLSPREFVEWFRDKHTIDGRRIRFLAAPDVGVVNLEDMSDEEAQAVAEQIMLATSGRVEGRA